MHPQTIVASAIALARRFVGCVSIVAALSTAGVVPLGPAYAQQVGESLPVVRCDPRNNSCTQRDDDHRLPALGAGDRASLLASGGRTFEFAIEVAGTGLLIPGCEQTAPGELVCQALHEFQQCRTLMVSALVESCRIDSAFASDYIDARAAAAGSYTLEIKSNARLRVTRDDRQFGQIRGKADVSLGFDLPAEAASPGWCLQRDRYLYHPTGPDGGLPEIGDTADCESPLKFSFAANTDDVPRAWNLCETFAAWGGKLVDRIEVIAAGLFHVRSANPEFVARYGGGLALIAPWVLVEAPVEIDCRR